MKIDEAGLEPALAKAIAEMGIKEFYPPQAEALPHVLSDRNLVLAVPTASGKSLVAYIGIVRRILKGQRAMYIVPLRALAYEKFEELSELGRKIGFKAALAVGDYDDPGRNLSRYDVIIATSEKADSLLRQRPSWLDSLGVIVADEVHLINDEDRGPTLEVILAKFKAMSPQTQLICLSATIANSHEIADWLGAACVTSEWRPVKLRQGVVRLGKAVWDDGSEQEMDSSSVSSIVLDALDEGGQTLVFVNTRKSSEALAERVAFNVGKKLTPDERKALEKAAKSLSHDDSTSMDERLALCIRQGAAFHNAGLRSEARRTVETLFKSGLIKCICATPTLAAGVNLPARRVLVRDTHRYDANLGNVPLPVLEVRQMFGRAGRPQFDPYGEALLMAKTESEGEELFERYIDAPTEAISSKLGSLPALRIHLMACIATGFVRDRKELEGFIESTFFAAQGEQWAIWHVVDDVLAFLSEEGLATVEGDVYAPTDFGRIVSNIYLDPLSAVLIRRALERAVELVDVPDLPYLQAISTTPDMVPLYMRASDAGWAAGLLEEHDGLWLVEPSTDGNAGLTFMGGLKTGALLNDWISELSEKDICDRYSVGPGDIYNKTETAGWLLNGATQLSRIFAPSLTERLHQLTARLEVGAKRELLPLISLRGVGRIRARMLWRAKLRTVEDLRAAPVDRIAKVQTIGSVLARKIKQQVGDSERGSQAGGEAKTAEEGLAGRPEAGVGETEDGEEATDGNADGERAGGKQANPSPGDPESGGRDAGGTARSDAESEFKIPTVKTKRKGKRKSEPGRQRGLDEFGA